MKNIEKKDRKRKSETDPPRSSPESVKLEESNGAGDKPASTKESFKSDGTPPSTSESVEADNTPPATNVITIQSERVI